MAISQKEEVMASKITVDIQACKGCLICIDACPKNILAVDKTVVNKKGYNPSHCFDMDACIGCGMCAIFCPDSAITVERDV